MIVTINDIPVYNAVLGDGDRMLRISLVDDPAVMSNFQKFAKEKAPLLYSVENEEKRLVLGVVMRADFPIFRRDEEMGEYYIVYKADTIAAMAEKYLLENRQNIVNLMHVDGSEVSGVDMVQYFLKDSSKGIAPSGFEDIADGSLFAEFHVTNDDVWNAIKEGTYKGFSLEGFFSLEPETDENEVDRMVSTLAGRFKRLFNNLNNKPMSKVKNFFRALEAAFLSVRFGSVSTDKGVLSWDGDDDLKAGDAVSIVAEDGTKSTPEDGDYKTEDGKTITVADGKVSSITDPNAEVAEEFQTVSTDKGDLEWDGEDDLKAGDAVYTRDADGNRVAAGDGDYVTEDGKTITVVDGKVSEISDPAAEVAASKVKPRFTRATFRAIVEKMSASYEEKERKIADAIRALGFDAWVCEAGDDYAVAEAWIEEKGDYVYYRFAISWNGEEVVVGDYYEVKLAFVPVEDGAGASESEEFKAVKAELARTKQELETLKKEPAAKPAHAEFTSAGDPGKTGNKAMDTLNRIMSA